MLVGSAKSSGVYIAVSGRFVRSIPNEIGSRSSGSNFFAIARYMKTNEIRIMTMFVHSRLAKPLVAPRSARVSRNILITSLMIDKYPFVFNC